jgi:hypothetical protein
LNRAACTIVSPNYLAYARTLAASYLAQHPGHRFFVLIVASLDDAKPFVIDDFIPIMLPKIGIPDLRTEAMKYEILELNTNVKPSFLKFLLNTYKLDQLIYLDPDIFCYSPLAPVFDALDNGASAVLTPHMTTPIFDNHAPSEQDLLYNGTYNLGFVAVSAAPESLRFLDWWERRCLDLGFSEGRTGLFVDQKWINHAPGFFNGIHISRDAGLNVAYWNLHERTLTGPPQSPLVASPLGPEVPLRFFHFSGVNVKDPQSLSRNTDRFTLASRPDLQPLFAAYKAAVASSHHPSESLPYGFDRFSDGTALNRLARRIFAVHALHFRGSDPFAADSPFARFARGLNLIQGQAVEPKQTWNDFNPRDRRVELVHHLLKLALRLLGPVRYELLMRYLAYISVLRNQAVFLNRGLPPIGDDPR